MDFKIQNNENAYIAFTPEENLSELHIVKDAKENFYYVFESTNPELIEKMTAKEIFDTWGLIL